MRQALLAPVGKTQQKPLVMWMQDDATVGDHFAIAGKVWKISQIYGTHFSCASYIRPCEKPKHQREQATEPAVPIDRN